VRDHDENLLFTGNEIIIDEELGDLYFHRNLLDGHIGAEGGGGLRFGIFKPEPLEIRKGPIRMVVTFKNSYYCLRWPYYLTEKYEPLLYRHKTVEITKKVFIYKDIPRIDFETRLNLLQPHVQLSVKFDTGFVAPRYARQTQFGVLEQNWRRSLRGSMKIPSMSWITAQEDGRGLAFLTLGVPINEIKGGEIYCTLLRSVSVLSADGTSGPLIPTPMAQELGEHVYRYAVYPYTGDWRDADVHRIGFEINQPLRAMQVDWAPDQAAYGSFSLEPHNLILSALKKTEDGGEVIFRFYETCGKKCRAKVGLPDSITGAAVVDLLEREMRPLDITGRAVELDVKPFEIVSIKFSHR
jgi:alpha-mannosidase